MMWFKILMLWITYPSSPNAGCCEWDKDGFAIFIRSLYTRGILKGDSTIQYVRFNTTVDESAFTEKVKIGDKILLLEKTQLDNPKGLLRIISISKMKPQKIKIRFVSGSSSMHRGTVTLGFNEENKPIFLEASVVTITE